MYRTVTILFLSSLLSILAWGTITAESAGLKSEGLPRPASLRKAYVEGELLVRVRPGLEDRAAAFIRECGGRVKSRFAGSLRDLMLVQFGAAGRAGSALRALRKRADIIYAELNYKVEPAACPNDPEFYRSWGLHNTGQRYRRTPRRSGTDDIDIDAPEAWDLTAGSASTVIAVIDTGVNFTDPDLSANIWVNSDEIPGNSTDDDLNGFVDDIRGWNFSEGNNDPSDPDGHGTSVASIAGATGNNSLGTCGACWNVSLMPIRVGLGEDSSIAQIVSAIQYAVDNGASVINASWGTSSYSKSLRDAIEAARAANVVFVAAAGNNSSNNDVTPYYPASYTLDNIVAVAAIDSNGALADFSNYGPTSVDIAAPGVDIYATDGYYYGYSSGTSAAAPFVSGAAALIIGANPGISYSDVGSRLIGCSQRLDGLLGKCVSSGMLNAYNALSYGQPAVVVDSVSQYVLGPGEQSAAITWTCKHDGTYSVEVGGDGTAGSGDVIAGGVCYVDDQIVTQVFESDLPDNQASPIYIVVAEALCAGFATVTLYDDHTAPCADIDYPTQDSTLGALSRITGTAQDSGGASVSRVGVALYDGSVYYDGGGFASLTPVYLDAAGMESWAFDTSGISWQDGVTYAVYVETEDSVGNVTATPGSATFTYLAGAPTLTIESISKTVLGAGDSAAITWLSDLGGAYSVRVGGTGIPGSGIEIESGNCSAGVQVASVINESDLADNASSTVYIFVTAAAITGSVGAVVADDQIPPLANITYPINNQTYSDLQAILGRASDIGGGYVASVDIQITDGASYWNGEKFTSNPFWVPATGTDQWHLDTCNVPWKDFTRYTVKTRVADSVANVASPSSTVEFVFNSGTYVPVKKKDGGCALSQTREADFSLLFLAALLLLTRAFRRHKLPRQRTIPENQKLRGV
jgi:subtilisin family serine protease